MIKTYTKQSFSEKRYTKKKKIKTNNAEGPPVYA